MESLSVETKFDYSSINNGVPNDLHLMVTVGAPEIIISDEQRPMLEVCIALDVSGSMGGRKIETMKGSAKKFIDNMSPKDRISIVAFSSHVIMVTEEPVYATRENKEDLKKKIDDLHTIGATNMSDTLMTMFELLSGKSKGENVIKRAIFFTDGCPTAGVQNYTGLIDIVRKRNPDISISTFGFGEDHDPELLGGFAKVGKGNNFYIQELTECDEYFGTELGGLLTTFAKDIVVKLKPKRGVTVHKILNDFSVKVIKDDQEEEVTPVPERIQVLLNDIQGDEVVISIANIYGEESRSVVAELKVTDHLDESDLVDVSVMYTKISDDKKHRVDSVAAVEFVGEDEIQDIPDSVVEEQVILLNSAQVQHEARYVADQGNVTDAERLLRDFDSALIKTACYASSENLQSVGSSIRGFADNMKSYNSSLSADMSYMRSTLSSGRRMSGLSKGMTYGSAGSQMENFTKGFMGNDKNEQEKKGKKDKSNNPIA